MTISERAELELRAQVHHLSEAVEIKDKKIEDLERKLASEIERASEAEASLKWKEIEYENQIGSQDAKIATLQRSLSVQNDISKLQNECQRLYKDREVEAKETMEAVVRRAKSPSFSQAKKGKNRKLSGQSAAVPGDEKRRSFEQPLLNGGTARQNPDPASLRAKVFRHKLSKSLSGRSSVDRHERADGKRDKSSDLYLYSISERSNIHRASLPIDYRASVATLPPILSGSRPSSAVETKEALLEVGSPIPDPGNAEGEPAHGAAPRVINLSQNHTESVA